MTSEWRFEVLGALASASAPRACTTGDLIRLIRSIRSSAAMVTARSAIDGLVAAKALLKIGTGLYLNCRCLPATELGEAAQLIRRGAVVSLESVLGECGFLNNPSAITTAVLPLMASGTPNTGEVRTSHGQVFRFYALPSRYLPRTREETRSWLQTGRHHPIVRPEVAALHWLYLARSKRSTKLAPPTDVDFDMLDLDLLNELATAWSLIDELAAWQRRVKAQHEANW